MLVEILLKACEVIFTCNLLISPVLLQVVVKHSTIEPAGHLVEDQTGPIPISLMHIWKHDMLRRRFQSTYILIRDAENWPWKACAEDNLS